jgi:hypothetical protein
MHLEERAFGFVVIGEPNDPGVQMFQAELDRYDVPVARFITYDLDVPQAQLIAANVIAQLREAGANTVVCVCDPLFPSFLLSESSRQLYFPEWIPYGWLLDTDQFGQLYDRDQMENAYTLSRLGVPTPNLFTGMQNYHGPLEWVSVQDMSRATAVCIELAQRWGQETRSALG